MIKGIQHADDAREAAARGIDGIVVSNHGGRQVDGAIASLDALPAIAEAAGDDLAILFDSGVRSGSDVIKALALGADAVCLGRPYIWGLALEGQQGVETVLKMVLAELDLTLALCGYTEPGQLGPDALSETRACPVGVSLNFFGEALVGWRRLLTTKKCKTFHPYRDRPGRRSEVAPGEGRGSESEHAGRVDESPDDQAGACRFGAAEGPELQDDAGQPRGVGDQRVQAGGVEALEGEGPAGGRGRSSAGCRS